MSRVDQFLELVNSVDMNRMSLVDQMTVCLIFAECMEKAEPILLKYAATNPNVTNFLFKL